MANPSVALQVYSISKERQERKSKRVNSQPWFFFFKKHLQNDKFVRRKICVCATFVSFLQCAVGHTGVFLLFARTQNDVPNLFRIILRTCC